MKKINISPFGLCENRGSFVLGDFFIVVNTDHQVIAESFRLPQSVGVTKMDHVIAGKKNLCGNTTKNGIGPFQQSENILLSIPL